MDTTDRSIVANRPKLIRTLTAAPLLGPAFVAAIAYVDPGNVAANVTGGARYGYLLVWVLVVANLVAVLVQYLSAKLGLATGASLPEVVAAYVPNRSARLAYCAQAQVVAIATDLAEVIGGAVALNLLFDVPLLVGGLITGTVSMALLAVQDRRGQRPYERMVTGLLAVIAIGFLAGLVTAPPDPAATMSGLVPRFDGADSVLVAASMLGATVMPHAVYLHSSLVRDRHGRPASGAPLRRMLSLTRVDVVLAMAVAGVVNIGMLLLAAGSLQGVPGTDTLEGAHAAIGVALGEPVALLFAVGLLASGLASTSVGSYAGAVILRGLLGKRVPVLVLRLCTLLPALAILAVNAEPTGALVLSQVVLSFGIPFAIVPMVLLTARRDVMGDVANHPVITGVAMVASGAIVTLNVILLYLTFSG